MTTPAATSTAPGAGLREAVARALFPALCSYANGPGLDALWEAPECYGYRQSALRMSDVLLAGPLKPILDALAASRAAEAAAIRERDEAQRQLFDLRQRKGKVGPELWGRHPKTRHWTQIDDGQHPEVLVAQFEADYTAAGWTDLRRTNPHHGSKARLAAANARAERLAEALRPLAESGAVGLMLMPTPGPSAGDPSPQPVYVRVEAWFEAARAALAEPAAETQEAAHEHG